MNFDLISTKPPRVTSCPKCGCKRRVPLEKRLIRKREFWTLKKIHPQRTLKKGYRTRRFFKHFSKFRHGAFSNRGVFPKPFFNLDLISPRNRRVFQTRGGFVNFRKKFAAVSKNCFSTENGMGQKMGQLGQENGTMFFVIKLSRGKEKLRA